MCAKNITTIDKLVTDCKSRTDSKHNDMLAHLQPIVHEYLHRKIALSSKDVNNLLDEMVQNTLIKVLNNVDKLQNADSKIAYIFSIATNVLRESKRINERDEQHSHGSVEMIALADTFETQYSGPLSETSYRALVILVVESFDTVDQLTVTIVDWRLFGNLTFKEIASEIGLSTSVCQKRFMVWRKKFEDRLVKKGYNKQFLMPAIMAYAAATTEAGYAVPTISVALLSVNTSIVLFKICGVVLLSIAILMIPTSKLINALLAENTTFQSPIHIAVTPETPPIEIKDYQMPNITLLQKEGVDVTFENFITDGKGDDIIITETGPAGEACELYAIGENGEMALLGIYATKSIISALVDVQFSQVNIGIDLAMTNVDFRFKKVRIISLSNDGQLKGFELCAVKSRKK